MINKNLQNQHGFTLYASFLPIVIILAIILGAGYFLMQGEFKLPSLRKDNTEVRRLEGFPRMVYVDGNNTVEKQRIVITSQQELNTFLLSVDPSNNTVLSESINFDKEYLIGVATDTVDTLGYKVRVHRVYEDKQDETLLIAIKETRPGDFCDTDEILNVAVDLVAITKTDWHIDFERVTERQDCENDSEDTIDDEELDS